MSLGFSIILGLTAALGSLIPMLAVSPGEIPTRKGILILTGLGIVLVGIYLCGMASGMRDASQRSSTRTPPATLCALSSSSAF
jgi:L-rhamnose-H+ transport protein